MLAADVCDGPLLIEKQLSPATSAESSTWFPAAQLLRPQGRRGELLADPLSDLPNLFAVGRRVTVAPTASAPALETTIESLWSPTGRNAGRIVLKLAGVDSISAAEALARRELAVLTTDLPELEPDTWFVRDLVGCQLFDGTVPVGDIAGVEYAMAPDGRTRLSDAAPLLVVTVLSDHRGNVVPRPDSASDGAEVLIPLIKAWLDSVDIARKQVVMHLPAGLLELTDERG